MSSNNRVETSKAIKPDSLLDSKYDFQSSVDIKVKYLILSSERSGSSMLSSALFHSGVAGAPFEYFNELLLSSIGNPQKFSQKLNFYFLELLKKRTSPNGVFGMKLHYEQFRKIFGFYLNSNFSGFSFLKQFDKFVFIYRQDKILQAISLVLANESKIWITDSKDLEGTMGRSYKQIDRVKITNAVNYLVLQEFHWREIIRLLNLPFVEIVYEDLEADPQSQYGKVLKFLEIENSALHKINHTLVKTSNIDLTKKLKMCFLKDIGATT